MGEKHAYRLHCSYYDGRASDFFVGIYRSYVVDLFCGIAACLEFGKYRLVPLLSYNTFRVVWLWTERLGFNIPVAPVISEWISTPLPTNTYSYLKPYYMDFGMVGVFGIPLLLGFCVITCCSIFRQKVSYISCYLLGFLMYALLMQPIEEQYFQMANQLVIVW